MSNKVTPGEADDNIVTKAAKKTSTHLYLDELQEGVTGAIVVMVGRVWDVNATTGRYLSTDFVVSDSKGNMIHCTAKGTIAHNFVRLKEGMVYLIKNFTVLPNKDEFRIFRNDPFMLEFDGSTTMRKVSIKATGFVRYGFQLVDYDEIQVANNKYLIDVSGYVTSVGRTTHTKTGSKTLDFQLANERGQTLRVTLWGGIGDALIEKKTSTVGMCAVVLTSMSAKMYSNKLYLSSTSSTVIYDDGDIPALNKLRSNKSLVEPNKEVIVADPSQPREGTIENLLLWARNRKNDAATFLCKVVIEDIRRKSGWNYPSCGGDKCRKSITHQLGKFLCETCHKSVDYPVLRYRLEVVVADDTGSTVVVLFNELASELLKCSADSLIQTGDTDGTGLPTTISNLIGTSHVMELKSRTYYEYGSYESFTCWKLNPVEVVADGDLEVVADGESSINQPITVDDSELELEELTNKPTIATPSKPIETKRRERSDVEDSNADEVSCPADEVNEPDTDGRLAKKKRKLYVEDDSD